MADKKKPIKQCRVKADTCFKWHCIGKLFGLSLEDIGLMYLISQIKDDEGKIIYGLIEEEILDLYQATEAEWMALHTAKIRNDEKYRMAFSELNGQRKTTTERYKQEVARREAYNARIAAQQDGTEDTESGKPAEVVITSDETKQDTQETPQGEIPDKWKSLYRTEKFGTGHSVRDLMFLDGEVIKAHFEIANAKNIISQAEFIKLEKESGDIELMKDMIARANKEGWKEHWETYL